MPEHTYEYDAFVSYRHGGEDEPWVRGNLVPGIEEANLRVCVDFRCFRLGVPVIKEIERAVQASAYTVAVMSPRYLESGFADLENVLAEHLGIERSDTRLIGVMREFCEPRLSLRARIWLDMTDDALLTEKLDQLRSALRQRPNGDM